jgi:[acyl-carrier-protein] S-malonyltransferase
LHAGLAFIFPGQGSQRIGMLAEASAQSCVVSDTFAEASDALAMDLWAMVHSGDEQTLTLTENTQPALLCASVALWRSWLDAQGPRPAAMAGHSLGEFSALCCAGAIDFADGLRLVRERGRFMQRAVPAGVGAMSAIIGLADEVIVQVCSELSSPDAVVCAVNFNSPGQVVIAGHAAQVKTAGERLAEAGARRVVALPVSAPFHTSLMQPAGENLAQVLEEINISPPAIPVIHNVTQATEDNPDAIRGLLVSQISSPVPWTACVAALRDAGCTQYLECGPGKVLGGLLRRIDKSLDCAYLEEPEALHAALLKLQEPKGASS